MRIFLEVTVNFPTLIVISLFLPSKFKKYFQYQGQTVKYQNGYRENGIFVYLVDQ